ncbi:MAG: DNA recombination protein RmuC [Polaromonas sp.]|nr:DNA recombination protein RmuC [Polaromonas sp.]
MTDLTSWFLLALAALNAVLLLWLLLRPAPETGQHELQAQLSVLAAASERLERELRTEVKSSARDTRGELTQGLSLFQQALLAQSGDVARTQNEQIDSFRVQLAAMQQQVAQGLQAATQSLTRQAQSGSESVAASLAQAREAQASGLMQTREAQDMALKRFADGLNEQLRQLSEGNERRLGEVRQVVEQRLAALQEGNEKKLDQMRATVDEKLQSTLETRLGESFKQVADRLEQVHKGLGEMQTLAQGVGDLKHLLTNVKTRGIFGEAQLAGLLEQVFTVDQYAAQVVTRRGGKNPVDFAIKLPGRSDAGEPLWLPIDAKFPNEDYERLLDAQQRADAVGAEIAGKALEVRIRFEAKSISEKYIEPPYTTDFAILFLPTEGLYAEVLRRPGLMESLQRDHRITLAGPTTLLAMLSSLQMGFRTLALEKRSSEVWQVLGAVKTEFGKFGDVLAKVKSQTETVLNTLSSAEQRSRVMGKALRSVEALPELESARLIPMDKDLDES